jgi:hypothetical protein
MTPFFFPILIGIISMIPRASFGESGFKYKEPLEVKEFENIHIIEADVDSSDITFVAKDGIRGVTVSGYKQLHTKDELGGDQQKTYFSKINVEARASGQKLSLIETSNLKGRKGLYNYGLKLTVEYPRDAIGSLNIETEDGDIKFIGNYLGRINVKTEDGDILVDAREVNEFFFKSEDGDLAIQDSSIKMLKAVIEDGDVTLRNVQLLGNSSIHSADGDIEISLRKENNLRIKGTFDDADISHTDGFSSVSKGDHSFSLTLNKPDTVLDLATEDGDIKISVVNPSSQNSPLPK